MSPRPPSDLPSTADLLDNLDFFAIALVVSATIFPGLTICIPGLLFVTVLVAIPIVAVLVVVGLVAAIVMAPFVVVRAIRRRVEGHSAAKSLAVEENAHVRVAA